MILIIQNLKTGDVFECGRECATTYLGEEYNKKIVNFIFTENIYKTIFAFQDMDDDFQGGKVKQYGE